MSSLFVQFYAKARCTFWNKTELKHWNSLKHVSASLAYFSTANKYASEAETILKLFQAVSVFSFSFISDLAAVRNKIV